MQEENNAQCMEYNDSTQVQTNRSSYKSKLKFYKIKRFKKMIIIICGFDRKAKRI